MKLLSTDCTIWVVLGLLSLTSVSLASQSVSRERISADKCGTTQAVSSRACWTSAEVAAPDSIEGQLRSQGMCWTLTQGEICVGVYVQDIVEGRLDQPKGRGAVGRVVSVDSITDNSKPAATVDFGRGYSVPIYFSELCPVAIFRGTGEQPRSSVTSCRFPVGWTSAEVAAPDSIEGQLRSQGMGWTLTQGEICVGTYVQDILEGRLDQPKGRGAIGRVVSISTAKDGKPAATVDFGRGYSVGIYFSELCPVVIAPGPKE